MKSMRLALLLLALPMSVLSSQEPVGAVIAWHRDLAGTPPLGAGWAEFDGSVHVEPGSPYHNLLLPDLNGVGGNGNRRFLRGATATGFLEADALQGHAHQGSGTFSDGSIAGAGCPTLMPYGVGGFMNLGRGKISVLDPITDPAYGTVRVHGQTRATNMAVVWILKTGPGALPVGSIVAWHRDFPRTSDETLPAGWEACDGAVLDDSLSPYHGIALPELNLSGRFLRGGKVSGPRQLDAIEKHRHDSFHTGAAVNGLSPPYSYQRYMGGEWSPVDPGTVVVSGHISDGVHGAPRVGLETRPVNMSVVWIIKTRTSAAQLPPRSILAYHEDPSAGLPQLEIPGGAWYRCDGQTVQDPRSLYLGQTVPDLNNSGRFLRGGTTSGVLQLDSFQGHAHDESHDVFRSVVGFNPGNAGIECGEVFGNAGTLQVSTMTQGSTASETRPVNMHIPWILYLPSGKGLTLGKPGTPPRSL